MDIWKDAYPHEQLRLFKLRIDHDLSIWFPKNRMGCNEIREAEDVVHWGRAQPWYVWDLGFNPQEHRKNEIVQE